MSGIYGFPGVTKIVYPPFGLVTSPVYNFCGASLHENVIVVPEYDTSILVSVTGVVASL